jgi:hypothetical protein
MKLFLPAFALVIILCGGADARPFHAETARVMINKEVFLSKSKLHVRFVSLIEDSRCPTDTACVWAGNAKITVRVSRHGSVKAITLNTNPKEQAAVFEGYSIKLAKLTPQPRSNVRIDRKRYQATLEIVRQRT